MNPLFVLIPLLGLGLAVLVNYLADVLPYTRRFTRPACPHCGMPFPTRDYLLMRRCRNCGVRRSNRSFIVLVMGMPAAVYVWFIEPKLGLLLGVLVLTYLALVFVIDVEHRAILHETSYFGAALGLVAGTYLHSIPQGESLLEGFLISLAGGVVGFVVMYVLYLLGDLFVRWLSKRRGEPIDEVALGFGDVNLTGVLGLILGPYWILYCLFLAILVAGFASIVIVIFSLLTKRYQAFMAIPYAPFLIFGAVVLLFKP